MSRAAEFEMMMSSRATFEDDARARALFRHIVGDRRFAPNRYGGHEPLKELTPQAHEDAVELLRGDPPDRRFCLVWLKRVGKPRCRWMAHWTRYPHRRFETFSAGIAAGFASKHLDAWLEYLLGAFGILEPWHALFGLSEEREQKNYLQWDVELAATAESARGKGLCARGAGLDLMRDGMPGVYWGNYLGPFYVDWFGRDVVDSVPCVEKRWLDTGGVFFTTARTPFDWANDEARALQNAVKEHLGADAFFDLDLLRRELAAVAPVPAGIEPERLLPPRRVPDFPFPVVEPNRGDLASALAYFEQRGYRLVSQNEEAVELDSPEGGGRVRITAAAVEYRPH